jgi:hypothetical protein
MNALLLRALVDAISNNIAMPFDDIGAGPILDHAPHAAAHVDAEPLIKGEDVDEVKPAISVMYLSILELILLRCQVAALSDTTACRLGDSAQGLKSSTVRVDAVTSPSHPVRSTISSSR